MPDIPVEQQGKPCSSDYQYEKWLVVKLEKSQERQDYGITPRISF
jgi:hypothetical protein